MRCRNQTFPEASRIDDCDVPIATLDQLVESIEAAG